MKLGFIGAGNMAGAIIRGVTSAGVVDAAQIGIYDKFPEVAGSCAQQYGVIAYERAAQLIDAAETVILAVKPNVFADLLPSISAQLGKKNPLIISIAAGKSLAFIEELLEYSPALVRVMPNINAMAGESMSAYCANTQVTAQQKSWVEQVFGAVGRIIPLEESQFALFTALASCSPAFIYLFTDSLARAAVKLGMNKQMALDIASQTVLGSAQMIRSSGKHPFELIDMVCSPGGTTIEGVSSLLESGFESSVIKAVEASYNKDKRV